MCFLNIGVKKFCLDVLRFVLTGEHFAFTRFAQVRFKLTDPCLFLFRRATIFCHDRKFVFRARKSPSENRPYNTITNQHSKTAYGGNEQILSVSVITIAPTNYIHPSKTHKYPIVSKIWPRLTPSFRYIT